MQILNLRSVTCSPTGNVSWLIAVAFIWGVTNALMKSGVQGLEKVHAATFVSQIVAELCHLVKNWRVLIITIYINITIYLYINI